MKTDAVTFDGQRWSNAEEDRVDVIDYDPRWPVRFADEAAAIRSALGTEPRLRIEHFGSTAIPGVAAKPIVDNLLILRIDTDWRRFVAPLQALGYVHWAENPRADRMFFVKGIPPYGECRTHHVHIRTPVDAKDAILFRDYLRGHPEAAARYESLKREMARLYPTDREAYTRGKKLFIEAILTEARVQRRIL